MKFLLLQDLPDFKDKEQYSWETFTLICDRLINEYDQISSCANTINNHELTFLKYINSEKHFLFYNWILHDKNFLNAVHKFNFSKLPEQLSYYKKHSLWLEFKSFLRPFIADKMKDVFHQSIEKETIFTYDEDFGYLLFLEPYDIEEVCLRIVELLDCITLEDWRENHFALLHKFVSIWCHVDENGYIVVVRLFDLFKSYEPKLSVLEVLVCHQALEKLPLNEVHRNMLERVKSNLSQRILKKNKIGQQKNIFIILAFILIVLLAWRLFL